LAPFSFCVLYSFPLSPLTRGQPFFPFSPTPTFCVSARVRALSLQGSPFPRALIFSCLTSTRLHRLCFFVVFVFPSSFVHDFALSFESLFFHGPFLSHNFGIFSPHRGKECFARATFSDAQSFFRTVHPTLRPSPPFVFFPLPSSPDNFPCQK